HPCTHESAPGLDRAGTPSVLRAILSPTRRVRLGREAVSVAHAGQATLPPRRGKRCRAALGRGRREHRPASTAPRAPRRARRGGRIAPLPVTEHSRVSPSRLGRNRRYSPVSSHGSRTQCRVLSFRGYVPATRHSSDLSHTIAELPAM